MEIEHIAIAARLANGDVNGIDTAGDDLGRLRARRRARDKGLNAPEPTADCRYRQMPPALARFKEAQGQAQKFSSPAHRHAALSSGRPRRLAQLGSETSSPVATPAEVDAICTL
jgi:hypothetical protein